MAQQINKQIQKPQPEQDYTLLEVINEVNSAPIIRQRLLSKMSDYTGRHTLNYVSMPIGHPSAFINDWDAEIIDNILRGYGKKLGKIDLILYSSGGFAESAERIINNIYSYCSELRIIIPTQAKSAATIVAMGASKILMSDNSEIGPIDPQMSLPTGGITPAQSVIKAYEEVMSKINEKQANNQPYDAELVMLSKFDPVFLRECRKYMNLAKDIALKHINKKMRKNNPMTADEIEKNFLDDGSTFSHGRLIGWAESKKLGLKVDFIDKYDDLWKLVWEIYIRTKIALEQTKLPKIIEDQNNSLNPGPLPVNRG